MRHVRTLSFGKTSAVFLTVGAAVLLLAQWAGVPLTHDRGGETSVSAEVLRTTRLGRALIGSGLLRLAPRAPGEGAPEPAAWQSRRHRGRPADQRLRVAARARRALDEAWAAYGLRVGRTVGQLPSSDLGAVELQASQNLLSLHLAPAAEKFLLDFPQRRGRGAEVPAFLSFFADGELRLETSVGVRVHGNSKRRLPDKSYRLYFRDRYGSGPVPASLFAAADSSLDTLILHNGQRQDWKGMTWSLTNSLAFDVAARLGVSVPATRPVQLILNGRERGLHVLTERIDDGFFARRYPDSDLYWQRVHVSKSQAASRQRMPYRELARWMLSMEPVGMDEVSERVDVEALTGWMVSIFLCSTVDAFQGAAVLDRDDPSARWFWVAWDMELSFASPRHFARGPAWSRPIWKQLYYRFDDPRAKLLVRLLRQDSSYRSYVVDRMQLALNHQVTSEFVGERLEYYDDLAKGAGIDWRRHREELQSFFTRRRDNLFGQMERELDAGPVHRVRVAATDGRLLEVDGFSKMGDYEGRYVASSTVSVGVPDGSEIGFLEWRLDNARLSSDRWVEVQVAADLVLEAVFESPPSAAAGS